MNSTRFRFRFNQFIEMKTYTAYIILFIKSSSWDIFAVSVINQKVQTKKFYSKTYYIALTDIEKKENKKENDK